MNRPKKNFPYVIFNEGSYDWAHPKEKELQCRFFLPDDVPFNESKTRGYVVKMEHEWLKQYDNAFEVATELKKIIDRYIFSTDKEEIVKLLAYLEANNEEFQRRQFTYEIALADYEIAEWQKKRESAQEQLKVLESFHQPTTK